LQRLRGRYKIVKFQAEMIYKPGRSIEAAIHASNCIEGKNGEEEQEFEDAEAEKRQTYSLAA